MSRHAFAAGSLGLLALSVYLFASAPPPLPERGWTPGPQIPIETVFEIVEQENDVVRVLWTEEIVGAGKRAGLEFDEGWRERTVDAGPLPALFLRETAMSLERSPIRLGLYLGSDYPIRRANRFEGRQLSAFERVRETREPAFFLQEDTGLHTGMFPDLAVAEPCVACHNRHEESPKRDWRQGDVMGATTWSYPAASVGLAELLTILGALRQGFRDAYEAFLAKARTFAHPPAIGDLWPRHGLAVPTADVFMSEVAARASAGTLGSILKALETPAAGVSSGSGTDLAEALKPDGMSK